VSRALGKIGLTKDGVTVAKEVDLSDPLESIGAQMVREVALKTNELAGDGTTTATVLAQAIISEGLKNITAGANPLDLKRGIDMAVEAITKDLEVQAKGLEISILNVATISANNDKEIGQLIAQAFEAVGKDGLISFETSRGRDTYMEVIEGIKVEKGYVSPHFVTDKEKMVAVLEDCNIFIFDDSLEVMDDIAEVLREIAGKNESALIIAHDFSEEVLAVLAINKLRGSINIAAIKTPGFGDRKYEMLEDISLKTGSLVISKETGVRFSKGTIGFAKKVVVGKEDTSIIGGSSNKEAVENLVAIIRDRILTAEDYDKKNLQVRLSRLLGGAAILHVGAVSEVEIDEKKDRVEDAINSTKSAVEEGIVAGGGVALLRALKSLSSLNPSTADELTGINIVSKAVLAPLRTILENGGIESSVILDKVIQGQGNFGYDAKSNEYVDMVKSGIIDPKKVTRVALENAASVAGMILTIGCVFVDSDIINQENQVVN
jgi:chaperonin GroEL